MKIFDYILLIGCPEILIFLISDTTMETLMIQSRNHFTQPNISKVLYSVVSSTKTPETKMSSNSNKSHKFDTLNSSYEVYPNNLLSDNANSSIWNSSDFLNITTNNSDFLTDYDYQMLNSTIQATSDSWSTCKEWTAAQHNLFQAANFFFAAAFLVPSRFKQSVLLVR